MLRRLVFSSIVVALIWTAPAYAWGGGGGGTQNASLTGETLTATDYTFAGGIVSCSDTGPSTFTMTATGAATGPYPGTFTETATVTIGPTTSDPSGNVSQFDATFTIDSPAGTVNGVKRLIKTTRTPALGVCGSNPVVPGAPCTPITAESFSLTAGYAATIAGANGTSYDAGLSPVSFDAVQEQCVESILHTGTFTESFNSLSSLIGAQPQSGGDEHSDRGDRHDRRDGRDGHDRGR